MFVKNRLKRSVAALCAGLMLFGSAAPAEEKRLGDYVYVPAMRVAQGVGTISLRVEGVALGAEGDRPVQVSSLSGAEFGVYVFSGDGELTPWANPLYPSEPMRIRTGEGETSFSLPEGMEFYLMQESAPQGYLLDTQLIRVDGGEIVVTNRMAGELLLRAQDSLGQPIAGVTFEAVDEEGKAHTVITDENGEAVVRSETAAAFAVREAALPEGVFAPLRVLVNGQESADASATVDLSTRTRMTFEHPASGSIEVAAQLLDVDANGKAVSSPLSGVTMTLGGEQTQTIVTDETGAASISLLEGLYDVSFGYAGEEALALSHTQGQSIVKSGALTRIDLTAARPYGRIVVTALCEKATAGGSISFEDEAGTVYGPYALDAEGIAVTDLLPAGEYRIAEMTAPDNTVSGGVTVGSAECAMDSAVVSVAPGAVSEMAVELLTMEKQTFGLVAQSINDQGEIEQKLMSGSMQLTLEGEDGTAVGVIGAEDGAAQIEALSGVYIVRMEEALAQELGVRAVSAPFALPGEEETITFAAEGARLILMSVDENGEPVTGATYSLLDSTGMEVVLTADAEAQGVSPLLAAGEVRIESIQAPENHDESALMTVAAPAGEATLVQVIHQSYGTANIAVSVQRIDERGTAVCSALAGVNVRLYSVAQDGQTLMDTGIELTSGEDGAIAATLKPGAYVAQIDADSLPEGYAEGESVLFAMENTADTDVQLVCMDVLGGVSAQLVGGTLTGEELAQVRFELVGEDGAAIGLAQMDGAFFAAGLPAGTYVLRQTQIPQGYTLAKDIEVTVSGGSVTAVSVPLEEYAVLSVSKMGITFNDRMQTYLVPLSGEYGVYTNEAGEMKPYPSADAQMTVWANVTPEQIAQGRAAILRLPADLNGTTYYLREMDGAAGFAADQEYHEVTLAAGGEATVSCTVSSDRGFFAFTQTDARTGEHVPGGEYELVDSATGETVLAFTLGEESYRNAMAVPVGEYTLRQLRAAQGYALSEPAQCQIVIEPYLTQGGTVTGAQMTAAKIPQDAGIAAVGDMYAANQEGLTLVMIEGAALAAGETLRMPQMTVRMSGEAGERTDIASVMLSGVTDAAGGRYIARVEYCLEGGGWQPSDARMTGELSAPVCVSLADVEDDIKAVRISYIDADTGLEAARSGFNAGQVSLNAEISAQGEAQMLAEVQFTGETVYRTQMDGEEISLPRSMRRELRFAAQGGGEFTTLSAGRDGRITGVVFFDEDADGVMDAGDSERYAGMTVSLLTPSLELVSSCRTDGSGRYEFSGLSSGEYVLQFEAGEKLVFSSGEGYSEHAVSGVADKQVGLSRTLRFDGDHTDYVVNAGCIYAAHASGVLKEKTADGTLRGYEGLNVELMTTSGADEEPIVVLTDASGAFSLKRILPGTYDLTISLPDGMLCEQAENGAITRRVTVAQGETLDFGEFVMGLKASVSGSVVIDEDGDGAFAQGAQPVSFVEVSLLKHEGSHSEVIAKTQTDEFGAYAFDDLYDGEYSVLFELGEDWTFARFGQDSMVYGAVSASGSTKSFALLPDMHMANVNAGITRPAQLEVLVFADEHADGQKGVYDEGLAGVTLSLIRQENGSDAEQITLTTGADGFARFDGLAPGEYVLAYQMPGIYRATKQVTGSNYPTSCVPQTTLSTGRSEPFTLNMGEENARKYIGAMLSGLISGTVYYDNNADARIGEDEPACAGVLVELLSVEGAVLDTRMPDENGQYAFEGLAPGRYSVRFSAQTDCGFSGTERSMTRGGVQKSEEPISTTRLLTVTTGSKLTTVHAGVVRLAALQGTLFVDSDADTAMGETEKRLAGVSVHLMNGSARNILMSTVTDENGDFRFDRVTPGTYLIRVDAPEGYVFSGAMAGSPLALDDVRDGRGYSAPFELLGGAQAQGLGFGLLTQGRIAGRIWVDEDYDGRLGEAEEGLRGATVALTDPAGQVIASKSTIRSGEFAFDGLMPGEYALSVTLADGYVFTAGGMDSSMENSGLNSGTLALGALEMGGAMENVTIGAILPSVVSGMAWLDENNDGRRYDGDAAVPGVRVTLTMLSGLDSGKTYETMTDASGLYRFDHVMPGEAQLRFELAQGYAFAQNAPGTRRVSCVPMTDGLTASTDVLTIVSGKDVNEMDVGVLPAGEIRGSVWEDAIYDGKADMDERGIALARVALVDADTMEEIASATTDENGEYAIGFIRPGEYTLAVELPDGMIFTCEGESAIAMTDASSAQTGRFAMKVGEKRENVNVGALVPAGVSGKLIVDWNENGQCEADEPGLSHAVITVMQGGTIVTGAKTQEDGTFAIDALRPGTYRLRVALPEGALFSANAGLTLAAADAQEGETAEYTLVMGQKVHLSDIPTVLAASVSGRAWLDANADGRMDAGEAPMTDTFVELLDESGAVRAGTKVSEDGTYRFGLLRSGTYAVRFTLGSGVLFADHTGEAGGSCVTPVEGSVAVTPAFALGQDEACSDMNVGGILPGCIGDTVFLDVNGNGLMDYREAQLSGVGIELMRVQGDGTLVLEASTVSDEYGYYMFGDLRPGRYVLRVLTEEGDVLTERFGAPLGEIDSDVNPETGETDEIILASGQTLRNIDIGFIKR